MTRGSNARNVGDRRLGIVAGRHGRPACLEPAPDRQLGSPGPRVVGPACRRLDRGQERDRVGSTSGQSVAIFDVDGWAHRRVVRCVTRRAAPHATTGAAGDAVQDVARLSRRGSVAIRHGDADGRRMDGAALPSGLGRRIRRTVARVARRLDRRGHPAPRTVRRNRLSETPVRAGDLACRANRRDRRRLRRG